MANLPHSSSYLIVYECTNLQSDSCRLRDNADIHLSELLNNTESQHFYESTQESHRQVEPPESTTWGGALSGLSHHYFKLQSESLTRIKMAAASLYPPPAAKWSQNIPDMSAVICFYRFWVCAGLITGGGAVGFRFHPHHCHHSFTRWGFYSAYQCYCQKPEHWTAWRSYVRQSHVVFSNTAMRKNKQK